MTTLRRHLTWLSLVTICLTGTITACSNTASRPRPATFDGDMRLAGKSKEFYSQHRVVTLNGHNLYDGRRAKVKDQKINCLMRDCKLQSGQHTINVEYRWSSLEAEKAKRKSDSWQGFLFSFGMLFGQASNPPNSRYYPCQVSISFDVQPAHDYILNVVHTDQTKGPEEFQVVESESRELVGSTSPSC